MILTITILTAFLMFVYIILVEEYEGLSEESFAKQVFPRFVNPEFKILLKSKKIVFKFHDSLL